MVTYIYLVEKCYGNSNKVYVGKSTNTIVRKSVHKNTFGSQITFTIIDEISSLNRKDWEPLETYWIHQFIAWGFDVVNIRKKGGSGPEFHTNETKEKMKVLRPNSGGKGKPKPGVGPKSGDGAGWTKGRPRTEETKQKIRKPKGPQSEMHKLKRSLVMRETPRKYSENILEQRNKSISESLLGRKVDWIKPKLSQIQIEEVKSQYKNGKSIKHLSNSYEVSQGTIRNYIRK
jgi:hypothetical protein